MTQEPVSFVIESITNSICRHLFTYRFTNRRIKDQLEFNGSNISANLLRLQRHQ